MRAFNLQGAALDWAVTRANYEINHETVWEQDRDTCKYSTDWAQGGPIIEREGITIAPHSTHNGVIKEWKAGLDWPMSHSPYYFGPTPLIAAMRCYVASKMGEEINIPERVSST